MGPEMIPNSGVVSPASPCRNSYIVFVEVSVLETVGSVDGALSELACCVALSVLHVDARELPSCVTRGQTKRPLS